MRARQYVSDVVGGEGAVLTHHAKAEVLQKKFEEAHILETGPVQTFLEKIQSDKEGYVLILQKKTRQGLTMFHWRVTKKTMTQKSVHKRIKIIDSSK